MCHKDDEEGEEGEDGEEGEESEEGGEGAAVQAARMRDELAWLRAALPSYDQVSTLTHLYSLYKIIKNTSISKRHNSYPNRMTKIKYCFVILQPTFLDKHTVIFIISSLGSLAFFFYMYVKYSRSSFKVGVVTIIKISP